jgi:plasmid maintenance system antidote protein VapI
LDEATKNPTISGQTLRARIKRLGITYGEAARRLGLTRDGLNKQMNGANPVSRQTELLLGYLEQQQRASAREVCETLTERRGSRGRTGDPV